MVKASNLRGRGGAGFPTGLKWTFLPKDHPGPIYMCINADESEPGTFNNRILMEDDPHQVIEGHHPQLLRHAGRRRPTSTCATNIRCRCERLQAAIDECYAAGYLGKNILGSEFSLDIYPASRRGGLHLRRRDRADRKPGRQAGLAADQAAVSGRRRRVPQADGRQQHRNGGLRHAHRRPRRRLVQDRSACRPIRRTRAIPAAMGRSSIASAATSTSPAATKRRWASPAAS